MNRCLINTIVIPLLISIISAFSGGFAYGQDNHIFTVVLDPGHGGKDPGACGSGSKEKDIVLSVAKLIGKKLASEHPNDIKLVYTRNSDVFVELEQRATIANKAKADIFISIHTDAVKSRSVYGVSTFTMGLSKEASNLEVAQRENSVILLEDNYEQRYEGFDPTSAESYIMFELMQDFNMEQSISLAQSIQRRLVSKKRLDRGVRQAPYWVLHRTSMPSVLVETGFISNTEEEKYLKSEAGKSQIANSIYEAIISYKKEYDSKVITQSTAGSDSSDNTVTQSSPATPDLYYSIQIAASNKNLEEKDPAFKGLKPIYKYKTNHLFKYTYGNFTSLSKAQKACKELHVKFPDAFVTAIREGKPITLEEAKKSL